jgi:hypothetical protein
MGIVKAYMMELQPPSWCRNGAPFPQRTQSLDNAPRPSNSALEVPAESPMSEFVNFALPCSPRDKRRLRAALRVARAFHDGKAPTAIDPALPDQAFFSEKADHILADLEVREIPGGFELWGTDTHSAFLAELIQICCPESLPWGFTWSDSEDGGGACAIFHDAIVYEQNWNMLKRILANKSSGAS